MAVKKSNVVLTGFMGAGKSSVGSLLAERLGLKLVETDEMVEEKAGRSIAKIFEAYGEEGFRDLESQVIEELAEHEGYVIVTGGGAIIRERNREMLRKKGTIVYLHAGPEALYRRLRGDEKRPLLQVEEPERRIRELLKQRMPYYSDHDIKIDTTELGLEEVAREIAGKLG